MLLFVHVAIAFIIKNVALSQYMQRKLFTSHVAMTRWRRITYAACALVLLALCWLVANAIPLFADMLSLIGALLCGPITFIFPSIFLLGAVIRQGMCSLEQTQKLHGSTLRAQILCHISYVELLSMASIALFILLNMGAGTASALTDLANRTNTGYFRCLHGM